MAGCINCGHAFVRKDAADGKPGTVYSDEGWAETKISLLCETCFDNICDEFEGEGDE